MDYGYQRLEREITRLERQLRELRRDRYRDRQAAADYFQVKGLWARRKALLEVSQPLAG